MDPFGNIHKMANKGEGLSTEEFERQIKLLLNDLQAKGFSEKDLVPIPAEEEKRVKKMNRKARRRWHALQRRKMRGKTS